MSRYQNENPDTFPTDEMRDVFSDIAAAFLQHEPFLNDPEKRSLVSSLYYRFPAAAEYKKPYAFLPRDESGPCGQVHL